MTDEKNIENRISIVRKYLKILNRYKKYSKEEILENIDLKGSVERYLYLVCQATIDLAETVISFKHFRKPTTMTEDFYILNEEEIIDLKLTKKMVDMVSFRNFIAHDYEKIDYDIVYDVLQNGLKDIEEFIRIIEGL